MIPKPQNFKNFNVVGECPRVFYKLLKSNQANLLVLESISYRKYFIKVQIDG